MDSTDDILLDAEEKMEKTLSFLHEEFSGIRTGKASPALVENVKVQYYGASVRLKEIAGISTPESRLIVINAYDPTTLGEIEKAIRYFELLSGARKTRRTRVRLASYEGRR